MNAELQHTGFSISKGGTRIFVSHQGGGASPVLLAMLAHGEDLKGSTISCDHMGEAAARLAALAGISYVEVKAVSHAALKILENSGISVMAQRKTLDLPCYKSGEAGEVLVDHLSRSYDDTQSFYNEVRGRLLEAINHNKHPSDQELAERLPIRVGAGGGGT